MATNPNGTEYRPLFFYEVYDVEGTLYGSLIDHLPAWIAEKRYDTVFHFEGRSASYWIATHDRSITRGEALSFAIRVHEGKVRIIRCDLSTVSR